LTARTGRDSRRARLLRRGLDTYISLPLFALALLAGLWLLSLHEIDLGRERARAAAVDAVGEVLGTYEAQVARSVDSIDQTLRVLKYAVERSGPRGALPELAREGLLPSGMVFSVSVVDRHGMVVDSNPRVHAVSVADQPYFIVHQQRDSGGIYISHATRDAANTEAHLHFTRRLDDDQGNFAGIVMLETDPAYFTSGYERSRLGERGMLGVVGLDGVARALRVGEQVSFGQQVRTGVDGKHAANAVNGGQGDGGDGGVDVGDGAARFAAARDLHLAPLRVVVGLDENEQMAQFERETRDKLWATAMVSLALAIGAALLWIWAWQGARDRARVRRAREIFAAASAASLDAFFVLREVCDAPEDGDEITDFQFIDVNARAEQMTGMRREELCGTTLLSLIPHARESGMFAQLVDATRKGGVHEEEWENLTYPQYPRWLQKQVMSVEGGIVAIVRDITERKLAEERMLHLAHHDTLTGLPNRIRITERLNQMVGAARANTYASDGSVMVAFIDLDGFKLVNDGLGHNAGDELLKVVAERMAACVRPGDTVGRFGGDEFVLMLGGGGDPTAVIERVRQSVLQSIRVAGQEVQVSCSIGVAVYPLHGSDAETLLMHADAAMYRAKDLGKNNYQFYTREMNVDIEEKLQLMEGMRIAFDRQQFRLMYQPKVEMRTGRIFGCEALVRWDDPERGTIGPDRFIPLAEESGMIVALGEWVLRTACYQNQAWQDAGYAPLRISVNVSPRQFEEQGLVARVARALADSGLDPQWLELEVTEGVIMRDLAQAVEKMGQLRAMGVFLSIDDFGTGYSSLSALKSFPISTLKIDKSFVRDLGHSDGDEAIASSIIGLAHRLKLRVIAEGVETEQQRSFLSDNGCDELQGYLISRPLAPDRLALMLPQAVGQVAA
jgi:diguanylate cyclase (GGDEF)-like protein/PAS domain S-box-containing protein